MMIEMGWVLFAVVCMSLLTAGLAAMFPPAYRPWWHGLSRVEPELGSMAPMAGADDHASAAQTAVQPVAAPLKAVESVDRRGERAMAFVGKDRRKAARAEARQNARRHGNGR